MAQPSFIRRSFKWFLLLCLFVLLLFVAAALWLLAAPREITGLSEAIIARLQPEEAPFELRAGRVALEWKAWDEPAHLLLENVQILSAAYDASIDIAKGGVNLKMLPLLWGKIDIAQLALSGLEGEVHLGDESVYIVNRDGKLFYRHHFDEKLQIDRDDDALLTFPIEGLKLQFEKLLLKDLVREITLPLSQLEVALQRRSGRDDLAVNVSGKLAQAPQIPSSELALSGAVNIQQQSGGLQLIFDQLNPQPICQKIAACADLPALDMPLSGGITLKMHEGTPQSVTLALKQAGKKGTLSFPPHLPETIGLEALSIKAQLDLKSRKLFLPELSLGIDTGTHITATASAQYDEAGLSLDAKARAEQMPVDHLYRYWPAGLAPQTREWATTKIRGGMATEAETMIKIRPDDLEAEFLPDDFLHARIEVHDSSVDYLQGFDKAKEARATVTFTGTTMTADVHRATAYSGTLIENSKLVMSDMNADGTPMTAALNVKTNPADVAQILAKLPNPNLHAVAEKLRGGKGNISGGLNLAFNAFGGSGSGAINWDALRYDIKANLANVSGVRLHKALPLESLSGELKANDDGVNAALSGVLEEALYRLSLSSKSGAALQLSIQAHDLQNPAVALQDARATYESDGGVPMWKIQGSRLDLSRVMQADEEPKEAGLRMSDLLPFHLTLDVAQLLLDGGNALSDVKGYVACPNHCESAKLNAKLADGALSLQIFREAGQRRLSFVSDRLGDLLRLVDAQSTVYGGALDVQGVYADEQAGAPLSGRVIMTDFFLRDAPILGRILNAGSLVGLVDALKGDGIRFDKFAADYVFGSDVLRIKDGKAAGPAMGVLIEGDINLGTNMIDISGNLAPAYVLNSLVGKVPLIGDLLVGGEGESVFAINYAARGDMDDPSVSVNPLSALTPGFTRRFFDVFDDGKRDTSAPEPVPSAPEAAPEAPPAVAPEAGGDPQWQMIQP